MDKVAQRAAQAQRNVARRVQRRSKQALISVKRRNSQAIRLGLQDIRQNVQDARRAMREDWEMGPLAPRRDLGFNDYGVVKEPFREDPSNYGMFKVMPKIAEKRCAWAGGVTRLNLAPGDRVVILKGTDKGRIDKIASVNAENGIVTLENHNRAMVKSMMDQPPRAKPMPLSVNDIRLVYPLTDPVTGVTRDSIIRQLTSVSPDMDSDNMTLDRYRYGKKWDRLVPGLNKVIPWPETPAPEHVLHAGDTARDEVEERTFYYGLTAPPVPGGVIDELRGKYSKFRTRHEEWYVRQKEAEAAVARGRRATTRAMQTPLEEFHEMQRALRDAAGEPELSEEMLARIGEVMAKSKADALQRAGVSEELTPKQ